MCKMETEIGDAKVEFRRVILPDEIDLLFHECAGYPGIHSPEIKDWIVKQQVTAVGFYSAYPDASVRKIWKALKIGVAFDALLDTASS